MIISIYSSKGGSGKTPISLNIALEKNYCIGTNEPFHVYDGLLSDDKIISIGMNEKFPIEIKQQGINIIYDLAGSISSNASSVITALAMSNIVVVPINNEYKSLIAGLNTINQVKDCATSKIIVVATKLQKQKSDVFSNNWCESEDFKNIEKQVKEKFGEEIPVLPLKYSKVFDNIFEENASVNDLMTKNALARYSYREVAKQFKDLYKTLGI